MKKMSGRERDVERALTQKVKAAGGLSYKWTSPGADGVPDRIVIMPGGAVYFIELKTDSGRLSKMQQYQIRKLRGEGCDVRVLYGKDGVDLFMEDVKHDQVDIGK